ncbi:SRPBCC domain-containing protein [Cellulosimicrobium arenosum]|uniref:SRPBCC domain-containing protein n=1 Tax=Cellulosimicrobium arenosum TaxID=2708133 RepID=A0A927IZH5_9MICO|nr:SRPBCC domain-containing protein [Cellulosimicrobium arenosum]MBD8078550.1 SRPBCC domain-containing protein [Cellulosimicrobium arenosum]
MSLAPIVHELRLACPISVAFQTYAQRIGEWWPRQVTIDPESFGGLTVEPGPGGRIVASHGAVEHEWGRVTVWEPAVRLAHTFTLGQPLGRASLVRLELWEHGGGSALRLEHGGWAPGSERVRARFAAWPQFLSGFALLAEHPGPEK